MDMEKAKRVVGDILDRQAQELQQIAAKKSWSATDFEVQEKLLKNMKEAACIMEMAEQGSSGRSGRRGYSRGYSGEGSSQGNYSGYGSSGRGYSGEDGYSERSRAANGQYRSGENYSGHSIEDRMIANLEEMAGRAGNNPYEMEKIQQGLDALRRIFN